MYCQLGNYKFVSETSGQVSASNIHAYLHHADTESFLGDIIIQKISESSKKETAFELAEKWRYYTYVWIKSGTTLTNFKMKFMLKRADDNSEYIQNEQKEYNLSVQQEMLQNDYFDLENNKEIHKWGYINTKDVTSLAVSLNTSNGDFRRYSVDLKINDRKTGEYLKMLCTHFKYTDSRWHEYEGICGWESGQTFCIGTFNKELDTAEKMKNYLLNNDVEIYYELAEQEELDLTEEQKQVLNNIKTFRGVNNIFFDNPIAKAKITYTIELSDEIKQQFIQGPVYAKVKLNNKTFFNKVEGTSSIYIPDAEADKITMEIRGNHYQEVRNSINELHLIDKEETDLGNGLSYKIEDETLILNGSVGSTYALVITTQSNIVDLIKAGEEWTLSAYGENLPELNTFVRITTANNTNALNILLNSETTEGYASISFNENSTTLRIMLSANAVYNNSKIKIKLEKGGTKTDYDKYCKMPSIYTPSEIATVKDNIKIIQCNSNFLKKQDITEVSARGLTGTVSSDGTITLNGTTTNDTYIQLTDELKITTYTNSQNFEKHVLPARKL